MPFAATWVDIESVTLGEVNQRQTARDTTYMWNFYKMIESKLYTKQK